MFRTISLIALFISVVCSVTAQQDNKKIGEEMIQHFFAKQMDSVIQHFDKSLTDMITKDILVKSEAAIGNQLGAFEKIITTNVEHRDEQEVYYYYTQFSKTKMDIIIPFNKRGKAISFLLQPHKNFDTIAAYDKGERYAVTLSNHLTLPGTLITTEHQDNNRKILAIFVHGSGPNDRDETVNQIKPFRDMAEGLATQGIASYRYDKRTKVHPQTYEGNRYTIDDEVTDDVIDIVRHFRQHKYYHDHKIVLIGHSLGGMMLPRIINKLAGQVNAGIMLAANARPLQELIIDQYRYIQSLNPDDDQIKNALIVVNQQIAYLQSDSFNADTEPHLLPLGLPASYWISLQKYKQVQDAKQVKIPLLIVQGAHDYQVTMKDFALWQSALKNRKNVTFKSYPTLNHLLVESPQMSRPEDYLLDSRVSSYFINDMAKWIIDVGKK